MNSIRDVAKKYNAHVADCLVCGDVNKPLCIEGTALLQVFCDTVAATREEIEIEPP